MSPTYGLYRRLPVHPHLLLPTPLILTPLAAVLRYRYRSRVPPRLVPTEVPITWSQVCTRFPLQWVIVQITASHIEGNFLLPDHFIVQGNFHHYADACLHFTALPPSCMLLLTHTSLTRLVLDRPRLPT